MAAFPVRQWRHDSQNESHGVRLRFSLACDSAYIEIPVLSPGQGLRTRAKRTTGKQGLRYTPRPEAPHYYPALTRKSSPPGQVSDRLVVGGRAATMAKRRFLVLCDY